MMNVFLIIVTFFLMEGVAWFTHKYVMHGFLWKLHRDHHVKENDNTVVERNDTFFLVFAIPAIILFIVWQLYSMRAAFSIASGITIYGLVYFLIHDVFIHQRIKFFRQSDNKYLKAIRKAHKIHHKHLTRENGECFGMLLIPWKYIREFFQTKG
jgi:beta-carotene 3-hydroxylase